MILIPPFLVYMKRHACMYIISEDVHHVLKLKMQSQNHMRSIFQLMEKE